MNGTVVQVAIGGWGNTDGFEQAARTEDSRRLFANNVKAMIDKTGADGVDIDWEYPG
jgi:GH18 family chitinase